jgi:segregation and condensation protein A
VVRQERTLSFETIFDICDNRLHAIFLFLSMLELVQQNYMNILIGEGRNNFIIEFNADRPEGEELAFDYEGNRDRNDPRPAPEVKSGDERGDYGQGMFPGFPDPSVN